MKTTLALLTLLSGLGFSTTSFATLQKRPPRCEMVMLRLGLDLELARMVDRYWNDETVGRIAFSVKWLEDFKLYKTPLAIEMMTSRRDGVLEVSLLHLSHPQFTRRFFGDSLTVTNFWKTSRTFDPTLAKSIAGIVKGALARADLDSSIHTLVVQTRGLSNPHLTRLLKGLGFQSTFQVYSRKRGHISLGPHSNLEMAFDLKQLPFEERNRLQYQGEHHDRAYHPAQHEDPVVK